MRGLLGVWAAGSLTLGTVALVFVLNGTGDVVLQPVTELGAAAFLVLLLIAVLVVALAALSRHADSWLTGHARGQALWTLVVLVGGLAGWGCAATVVLALNWAPAVLLVLAYVGGGLPFAVVAAVLARSPRLAGAALGAAVVLVLVGAALVGGVFPLVRLAAANLALLLTEEVAVPL
ncbi:hypothetical protein [Labedaea rhizosphaerae]|uniref:Uncharacterized protein n=1 Tax=Labedaea rhizosphaerae TaxID=598644 RepID=A0A4V3CYE7_LABRH|nr:hypothetical protein [Labedaea rhizosphaerae]TDP93888.1 hypothetical protein EV186_106282 [Labedaea rhizosphaerae]